MRSGTKVESRSNEGLVSTFTLLLLQLLTNVYALALHSICSPLFFWPFPWARIGGTMVREKHRPTFSHWHDDDSLYWARHWKPRYVMWRWRRWRPNRPNLPLFPARDQNTWFSKGRIPPFSPPFCATLFCAIQSSLLEITRYRSIWNGFSWNWDGQFYLILFILFNGAATVASLRHDIHKKKMSDN